MKVILKVDIKGVGKKNQVINAADGYARNFLLPKGLGVEANAENMSKLQSKQDAKQYQKDQNKEEAQKIANELSKMTLKIKVKVGESGKFFGGISSKDISEKLKKEYKIDIDKKKIDLKEAIKVLGITTVSIKLAEGVTGKLKVDILPE